MEGSILEKGVILQMQDYSIHDGDGVRTTIFFAGCPLRCQWCANPETWTQGKKLLYFKHKCKNCLKCIEVCHKNLNPTIMDRPNPNCSLCGECIAVCPNKALSNTCEEISADSIVKQIKRDALFFRFTGGGVTFSGGEPFSQKEFLRTLVNRFFDQGINMWIETCGHFDFDSVKDIIKKLDHVFMDIKHMDSAIHKEYTGKDNGLILCNAIKIYNMGIPITFRIPSISDLNLTEKNIRSTARFIRDNMPEAEVELLPYHELGKAKFIALGKEDEFKQFKTPSKEELSAAYEIFNSYNIKVMEYK